MAVVSKKIVHRNVVKAIQIKGPRAVGVSKWMGPVDPDPGKGSGKPTSAISFENGQPSATLKSTALDREVVFGSLYTQEGMSGAIKPPYDPDKLSVLVEENNALGPCIEAMITNVDGTGFEVIADEDAAGTVESYDGITSKLKKFFDEPWPRTTFLSLRKRLRRDLETTGNAYVEVIRSLEGKIALVRRLDPCVTRIMRLGNDSYEEEIWSPLLGAYVKVAVRRRRYVQYVFGKLVYFKEFGAPMALNRQTGVWGDTGATVDPSDYANEVIHIACVPHYLLPYGVPRWIQQTPSIIGSRRAEEFNLGFFDQGGIPPMLIIIQGGEAADDVETAIKDMFYSAGPQKTTAAVLQVQSTSGDVDDPGQVKVTVERFGTDRQKDQLFTEYDKSCEAKVRRSWRLPEIFVGEVKGTNYANMLASYRVAEAQIFKPSRDEFDEMVTNTLLRDILGNPKEATIKFRSLPIVARDMDNQLKAIEMLLGKMPTALTPEEAVDVLNEITGLAMNVATPEEQKEQAQAKALNGALLGNNGQGPNVEAAGVTSLEGAAGNPKGAAGNLGTLKSETRSRLRGEVDVADVLGEGMARILFSAGDVQKSAFDSVQYLSRNPGQRDQFGKSVAKRLFACVPAEEEAAGRLAEALVHCCAAE